MRYTLDELKEIMQGNDGSLDLRGTGITVLPDGLTVGGSLDLEGCTGVTVLPDGLTVGGNLYLSGTGITVLPDGLTVGGNLYLRGTGVTDLSKVKRLHDGDYVPGRYLYADGILTHIRSAHVVDGYTLYKGKIPGKNVVSDGTYYAHCKEFREGIADIAFKRAKKRGKEQFRDLTPDSVVTLDEAKTMYRIITGACRAGTEDFVSKQRALKETYTIREMMEITKGAYGADRFKAFWDGASDD